jgi:succinoglycan biosynthesis protein ExoM
MLCSVCVATYRRAALLDKLLESLRHQILSKDLRLEIIIVDNDPERSAEPVVRKYAPLFHDNVRYFVQPIKNISLTRNMAVKNAAGEYLFFIDDDEAASPHWMNHHLRTLTAYEADGVFGPVIPEFNDATPEWMKRSKFFADPHAASATGAEAKSTWSGNCLLKASLLREFAGPFDPGYGMTGGEDTHLFERLKRRGARFVYCREATVSEYLPPNRTRVAYLLKRGFRWGNTHTRRLLELAGAGRRGLRLSMLTKSLGFGVISLLLAMLLFPSAVWRTYWQIKLASNVGRFFAVWGWHYQAYQS